MEITSNLQITQMTTSNDRVRPTVAVALKIPTGKQGLIVTEFEARGIIENLSLDDQAALRDALMIGKKLKLKLVIE